MNLDEIPVYDKPVGVMVSGGADSALLLYILLQKYQSTIQIFTIANHKKFNYNAKAAIDVISKCIELTKNNNVEHHIFHRFIQQDSDFEDIPKLYQERNLVNKVFHGITANPPTEIVNTFPDEQSVNDIRLRNPDIIKDECPKDSHFILPWVNINKKDIYYHYKNLGLLESLYPITRSCESIIDLGPGHCGKCWWCYERQWAFGKL